MSETDMIEEDSNPYNMKKSWHEADGKRMPQADELYYEDEAPSPKASRQKRAAPNEDSSTTNHNYKKRYDDLKRKHNRTIDEFKQKESVFQTQLQATQPKYEVPKSQEELQQFKNQIN